MNTEVTPGWAHKVSGVDVSSKVLFTAKGKLVRLRVLNRTAAAGYLMIFDAAALPNDGATPDLPPVPLAAAGSPGCYYETDTAEDFELGCVVAFSSTGGATTETLTLNASGKLFITGGTK